MKKFDLAKYLSFDFLKYLTREEKKEYFDKILGLIFDAAMNRVYKGIGLEKQKEMLELFNKDGFEKEKESFLSQYAPNFKTILIEESIKLKNRIEEKLKT